MYLHKEFMKQNLEGTWKFYSQFCSFRIIGYIIFQLKEILFEYTYKLFLNCIASGKNRENIIEEYLHIVRCNRS